MVSFMYGLFFMVSFKQLFCAPEHQNLAKAQYQCNFCIHAGKIPTSKGGGVREDIDEEEDEEEEVTNKTSET